MNSLKRPKNIIQNGPLPVKTNLFRNFNAHTNEGAHKNHCIKRPSIDSILRVFPFFPSECHGLCRHRPGHSLGGKGLTDRAKPSEVARSFYAMVFMAPSVCSSINIC